MLGGFNVGNIYTADVILEEHRRRRGQWIRTKGSHSSIYVRREAEKKRERKFMKGLAREGAETEEAYPNTGRRVI